MFKHHNPPLDYIYWNAVNNPLQIKSVNRKFLFNTEVPQKLHFFRLYNKQVQRATFKVYKPSFSSEKTHSIKLQFYKFYINLWFSVRNFYLNIEYLCNVEMLCSFLFLESRRNNEGKTHLNMHCRCVSKLKNSFPSTIHNEPSYILIKLEE